MFCVEHVVEHRSNVASVPVQQQVPNARAVMLPTDAAQPKGTDREEAMLVR